MLRSPHIPERSPDRRRRRANLETLVVLALLAMTLLAVKVASADGAAPLPSTTRLVYAPGKIVPLPASVPHEPGDMVDRRIVPDLVWLAERYSIFVTDGYSGPLPSGSRAGCNGCHVRNSDHYNGLAVDIVPAGGGTRCDADWAAISRLARWAEPRQNRPRPPFRWVGYNGDAGHGCGHHLHLSWNHATVRQFRIAEWVEVFPASTKAGGKAPSAPVTPSPPSVPPAPDGPPGGIAQVSTGGLSARGD